MPPLFNAFQDRLRAAWEGLRERFAGPAGDSEPRDYLRFVPWLFGAIAIIVLVYYPIGMLVYSGVDDDVDLQPAPSYTVAGGSAAVAMASTVIDREANHWLANKPFWHPAAALDNTPNFQLGVMYAISRFALELSDYLGRNRGSSAMDRNLEQAAGLLKYDGRTWYWGQGNFLPMAKAESNYRQAAQRLAAYDRDVAAGRATYSPRADSLIAFLDRVTADLGSARAALQVRAAAGGGYFDFEADDVFYNVKGKLYGYYVIMRALDEDFAPVIKEKQATEIWANTLESLRTGAAMNPLIIVNGRQDSLLMPSHLSALGFYLLSARTQIGELRDIMLK